MKNTLRSIWKITIWPLLKIFGLIIAVVVAGVAAMVFLGGKRPNRTDSTEEQHEIQKIEDEVVEIVETITETEQQAAEITETIKENTTEAEDKINEVMTNDTSNHSTDDVIDAFFDTWN